MALSQAQLQTLKADILADSALAPIFNQPQLDNPGAQTIANAYNVTSSPANTSWAWKTLVTEEDCTSKPSIDATNWSWPDYIARSVAEKSGWERMFVAGRINASLANVRQGFQDIFSGAQGATQRAHLLAVARRQMTRGERLFATGTGSTASPASMTHEGLITVDDVLNAKNLP